MSNYCNQAQINLVHGFRNINVWADLDNEKNPVIIAARVAWAAELATDYLNGRLMLGRYEVPFSAVPKMIIHMSALLAGVLLYDGRVQGDQTRDLVVGKRKEFRRLLRELLSGQMKLTHPTSGDPIECTAYTAPFAIGSHPDSSVDGCGCDSNQYCYTIRNWCQSCMCRSCICDTTFSFNNW